MALARPRPSTAAAVVVLGALVAAPLAVLAWQSLHPDQGPAGLTLANYRTIADQAVYRTILARTYLIGLIVTAVSVVAGVGVAAAVRWAHRRVAVVAGLGALAAPLLLSPVLVALAWLVMLQDRGGVVNQTLGVVGLGPYLIYLTRAATVVGLTYLCLPVTALTTYVGLRRVPDDLMSAARSLGAGTWAAFRTVALPIAAPMVTVATLLAFTTSTGAYLIPETLGGPHNTLVAFLVQDAATVQIEPGLASALAVTLLVTACPALIATLVTLRRAT